VLKLDKGKLKRYVKNRERLERINDRIEELCNRDIDVVYGKVIGSSRDYPYTEVRTTVQMYEPTENDRVNAMIRGKEAERITVEMDIHEVEEYIHGIEDMEVREIFELSFIQGKKQDEVAATVGYSRGRISQIISAKLKD
jgi:DNA-directed RNA polymerase specialized sigma subunit